MKIFSKSRSLSVWDKEKGRMLCTFVNGVCETEDERTIEILTKMGLETEFGSDIIVESKEVEEESLESLRERAKALGIKGTHLMKKPDTIKEKIAAIEGA